MSGKYDLPRLLMHMKSEVSEHADLERSARHLKDKRWHNGQATAYKHIVLHLEELCVQEKK